MKELAKGRIVSADELTELTLQDDSLGITYEDIKEVFSSEDLAEYNRLCRRFTELVGDKNNIERWDMLFDPIVGLELVSVLNRIEELRGKYSLPGTFYKVWRAKPLSDGKFEYDEIAW